MATARQQVADRVRGLYGLADAGLCSDPERLARQLLEGGCRLVQLRCKDWPLEDMVRVGRALRGPTRAMGATLVINDHAEVAVACDADGLHVGQLDAPTAALREVLGPDRILGRSTHDPQQLARAAAEADYVAFGPVFHTAHTDRPKGVRGLDALRRARGLVGARPLVAIGGIGVERVDAVREAGADAWAVIGAVALAPDPVAATRALCR